jgi:error-prone DNA polymerase
MKSKDERVRLPPRDVRERLATSFAFTGVSLEGHLTTPRRDAFTRAGAQPIHELPHLRHGQKVKIGGLIVTRQHPPTARGFCFLAVQDPDGMVNVVVPPDVCTQCR